MCGRGAPCRFSGAEKLEWVGLFLASRMGSLKTGIAPSSSVRAPVPGDPQSPSALMRTCAGTDVLRDPLCARALGGVLMQHHSRESALLSSLLDVVTYAFASRARNTVRQTQGVPTI